MNELEKSNALDIIAQSFNIVGEKYKSLGLYNEAMEAYRKSIEINQSQDALIGLWHSLDSLTLYDQALDLLLSNNLMTYDILCIAYYRLKDWKNAGVQYRKYIEAFPSFARDEGFQEIVRRDILGSIYEEMQNFFGTEDYQNCIDLFDVSIEFLNELPFSNEISFSILHLYLISYIKINAEDINVEEELKKGQQQPIIKLYRYSLKDKINFGKYRGYTIEHILEVNSQYLLWALINCENFYIDGWILNDSRIDIMQILYGKYRRGIINYLIKSIMYNRWVEHEKLKEAYDDYLDEEYYSPENYNSKGFGDDVDTNFEDNIGANTL